MTSLRWAGKVALVTGASRGVGAAIAARLAAGGCAVVCAARSTNDAPQRTPGTLDQTVATIRAAGGQAVALPVDLAVPDQASELVVRAVAEFGRLDLLVNNAAVTFVGDLDIPQTRYDLIFAVNTAAPLLTMRAAREQLRDTHGAVLNISSVAALHPYPGLMAYGMSKAALERLSVDIAQQWAADRVPVNCLRIDVPVASEGFVANTPGVDHSAWLSPDVAAEGAEWMLSQPWPYSGRNESMWALARREQIMSAAAAVATADRPPQSAATGLVETRPAEFADPV